MYINHCIETSAIIINEQVKKKKTFSGIKFIHFFCKTQIFKILHVARRCTLKISNVIYEQLCIIQVNVQR